MHGGSHDHFELHCISKIEGHASLSVDLEGKTVSKVEFKIAENNRFFEQLVVGKSYKELPLIVGRICGFCSSSHMLSGIEAAEKAFGMEPSEQTFRLRELLMNGEFIKSHALHLFFLSLPDYFGKPSALEFDKKQMKFVEIALSLKNVATELVETVGGRAYHDLRLGVGGFYLLPSQAQLERVHRKLEEAKKLAVESIELFASLRDKFSFSRATNYVALSGKGYNIISGEMRSSTGVTVREEDFSRYFSETVVPYSTSKQFDFEGKEYMVGALARININGKELCGEARGEIKELNLQFPSDSRFFNNLAQAIEILQCIESSIGIIHSLSLVKENIAKINPRNSIGIGVVEAPRGTLYHEYKFDEKGLVKAARIVVPTSQNTRNMEKDIAEFLPTIVGKKSRHDIEHDLEKLIRAYDPCISCATHFLKVKWGRV